MFDFSNNFSKSSDSLVKKEGVAPDYISLLHKSDNNSPASLKKRIKDEQNELIIKNENILSDIYKSETPFHLEEMNSSANHIINNSANSSINSINNSLQEYNPKSSLKRLKSNNANASDANEGNQVSDASELYKKSFPESESSFISEQQTIKENIKKEKSFKASSNNVHALNKQKLSLRKEEDMKVVPFSSSKVVRNSKLFLNFEFPMQKTEKRRSQFLDRRASRRVIVDMNPRMLQKFVEKSEKSTTHGKNKKYLKWLDLIMSCLILANIVVTLIDNELYLSQSDIFTKQHFNLTSDSEVVVMTGEVFNYMQTRELTVQENFMRFMNCVIIGCNFVVIVLQYYLRIRILRSNHQLSEYEGLWKSGLTKSMLMEMFFVAIVYPPYMNHIFYGKMLGQQVAYTLNSVICVVVTFKFVLILRVYTYFSRWTSETARSICNKYNVVPGVHFALKAELKKRPYTMLILCSLVIVTILSFAMRAFEYYVTQAKDPNSNLQLLQNAVWVTLITMTTVGYGDVYPRTHLGRFVGVISCVIGVLLVSLIVVSLAIISEFNSEEKKAYSIIKKINADNNVVIKAQEVVKTFLKLRQMLEEKKKFKLGERFIIVTQLKKGISTFKNDSKIANSHDIPVDDLLKNLEFKLNKEITTLGNEIKKIAHVDKQFKSIADCQNECIKKLEIIQNRQESLGRYLVEVNNEHFKENFFKSKEKKKLKKSFVLSKMSGSNGKRISSSKENSSDNVKNVKANPSNITLFTEKIDTD